MNHRTANKLKINQRGVFITLTAFILAGMLLLSSASIEKTRSLEENAITLSIAAQKNQSIKETLLGEIKNAYKNSGIEWSITDNNTLFYKETFPSVELKAKLPQNLAKLKAFFSQQYPNSGTYSPENSDLGLIQLTGKDMNIKHSDNNGFGTNQELYFFYSAQKFSSIRFDINTNATSITKQNENLPLCTGCSNPLELEITIKNSVGTTVYSFNNTIDLSQTGLLDFNTSQPTTDINFTYSPAKMLWKTSTTTLTTKTTLIFNNPLIEILPAKEAINITEMSSFGIKG
jgi:hypothetical protein